MSGSAAESRGGRGFATGSFSFTVPNDGDVATVKPAAGGGCSAGGGGTAREGTDGGANGRGCANVAGVYAEAGGAGGGG
jgi:hypothetical protein